MKGKIYKVNRIRGMVAIQTESGDFSVFERGEEKGNVGDEVEWNGDGIIGEVVLKNHSRQSTTIIIFKYHRVPLGTLNARLLFAT